MIEKRTEYIDLAAGIMLAWMILGHIASHASYKSDFLIIGKYLSFFMPWFFIYLLTMLIALPILNKLINTIESSFIHE